MLLVNLKQFMKTIWFSFLLDIWLILDVGGGGAEWCLTKPVSCYKINYSL